MQLPTDYLTDTLVERVDRQLQARNAPLEWGHPRLSATPTTMAIDQLIQRIEALENAVLEIALEVQNLSHR